MSPAPSPKTLPDSPDVFSHRSKALALALRTLLALAVAMGVGRFAFTPLLPMMLGDGIVNLQQGGWLATSNYLGYFIGALLCIIARGEATTMIRTGLVATLVMTAGMGLTNDYAIALALRFMAGVASAFVFIYASGWCLQRLSELNQPALAGIIYCGPGLGIALTGFSARAMVMHGWSAHSGWILFSLIGLVLTAMAWRAFRKIDHDIDARLASTETSPATLAADTWLPIIGYGAGGFGYIITATFLPVIAREALPGSSLVDVFWPLFGLGVAGGALIATRTPLLWSNRRLLSACYVMQAAGILTGLAWPSAEGFIVCSLLLGLPFTAITLFAMREARRLRGMHARPLMALMTAAYGLGQIVGPPLATQLVRRFHAFTPSLLIAAGILITGAVMFWLPLHRKIRH